MAKQKKQKARVQDVEHKPFAVLLASRPPAVAGRNAARLVSLFVHVFFIGGVVYATLSMAEEVAQEEDEVYVELVPETVVPPPPPPPQEAEMPDIEEVKTFQTLTVPTVIPPDIPPPSTGFAFSAADFTGEGVRRETVARSDSTAGPDRERPSFTPFTVSPTLMNAEEVTRALEREYPPMLRDAAIGGTVVVWLYIDTEGRVENTKVNTSSGYPALDEAALAVAGVMRFTAAMNRDKKVPVWVSIPVTFRVA